MSVKTGKRLLKQYITSRLLYFFNTGNSNSFAFWPSQPNFSHHNLWTWSNW